MNTKPFIGQKVRLNDVGLETCRLTSREEFRQSECMTITDVDSVSLTSPEMTYAIDVDKPLINKFLLSNYMVDPI